MTNINKKINTKKRCVRNEKQMADTLIDSNSSQFIRATPVREFTINQRKVRKQKLNY
jgi:hypothetical protein